MSRLAELLTGMDRTAPQGLRASGVPDLALDEKPERQRRVVGPVIVLALLAAFGLTIMVRAPSGGPTVAPKQSPVIQSVPAPMPRSVEGDQPFRALRRQGLEAARERAFGQAAEIFERALELNPADHEGWNNLGVVLIQQGDLAGGVEAFRRALRLNPAYADAHRNLAVALERQGNSREAIGHYRSFLALSRDGHPDRAGVRRHLGELGVRRGEE